MSDRLSVRASTAMISLATAMSNCAWNKSRGPGQRTVSTERCIAALRSCRPRVQSSMGCSQMPKFPTIAQSWAPCSFFICTAEQNRAWPGPSVTPAFGTTRCAFVARLRLVIANVMVWWMQISTAEPQSHKGRYHLGRVPEDPEGPSWVPSLGDWVSNEAGFSMCWQNKGRVGRLPCHFCVSRGLHVFAPLRDEQQTGKEGGLKPVLQT